MAKKLTPRDKKSRLLDALWIERDLKGTSVEIEIKIERLCIMLDAWQDLEGFLYRNYITYGSDADIHACCEECSEVTSGVLRLVGELDAVLCYSCMQKLAKLAIEGIEFDFRGKRMEIGRVYSTRYDCKSVAA